MFGRFFRLVQWRHSQRGHRLIGNDIDTRNQLRHKQRTQHLLPLLTVRADLRHPCRWNHFKICLAQISKTHRTVGVRLNFRPSTISIEISLVRVMLAYLRSDIMQTANKTTSLGWMTQRNASNCWSERKNFALGFKLKWSEIASR